MAAGYSQANEYQKDTNYWEPLEVKAGSSNGIFTRCTISGVYAHFDHCHFLLVVKTQSGRQRMIYDPVFWATWALGVTLHMYIYKNQAVGFTNVTIILALQIVTATGTAVLSKQFGALAAVIVIAVGWAVTYLIVEKRNEKRRGVNAERCLKNLSQLVEE